MRSSTLSSQRTTAYTSRSRECLLAIACGHRHFQVNGQQHAPPEVGEQMFMSLHCSTLHLTTSFRQLARSRYYVGNVCYPEIINIGLWPVCAGKLRSCGRLAMQHNRGTCKYGAMRSTWHVACCKLRPTCKLAMQHNYAGACANPETCNAAHSPSRFQSTSPHRSEAASGANVCTFISVLATWCGVLACVHVSAAHPHRPPQILLAAGHDRDTRQQVRRTPPDTH
jgi:hypothetical protein